MHEPDVPSEYSDLTGVDEVNCINTTDSGKNFVNVVADFNGDGVSETQSFKFDDIPDVADLQSSIDLLKEGLERLAHIDAVLKESGSIILPFDEVL